MAESSANGPNGERRTTKRVVKSQPASASASPPPPPVITSSRRQLSNRTSHSQSLNVESVRPSSRLTTPKKLSNSSKEYPIEQALYVPRHRRLQETGNGQKSASAPGSPKSSNLAESLESFTNNNTVNNELSASVRGLSLTDKKTKGQADVEEGGGGEVVVVQQTKDDGKNSQLSEPESTQWLTNPKPADRRALILSFIENAGKDDVIAQPAKKEKGESWEDADFSGSEDDEETDTSSSSRAVPSSPSRPNGPHANVLEVHGFSPELSTVELKSLLSTYQTNVDIRWIDDTHALAVFKSAALALDAYHDQSKLPLELLLYKDASVAAKRKFEKSQKLAAALDSRERPVTTSAVATRLVSGALGIRVKRTPEQIAADQEKMRLEREKRRTQREQAAKQKAEQDLAWES